MKVILRVHDIIYKIEYIKSRKFLTEEEAVDYLIQILNGFKTLVKNRIMHRDFKLANILKHDG